MAGNSNLKVCLVVGGVVVFLLGLVVIGSGTLLYLNRDKVKQGVEGWAEGMKERAEEGETFGAETDQSGCLDEGLRRSEGKGSLGSVSTALFLAGCLRSAEESDGFCDGVPATCEIMATVAWSQRRCLEEGRANDQACIQVMQAMQRFCNDTSNR